MNFTFSFSVKAVIKGLANPVVIEGNSSLFMETPFEHLKRNCQVNYFNDLLNTGFSDDIDADTATEMDIRFIKKPVSANSLIQAVKELLGPAE